MWLCGCVLKSLSSNREFILIHRGLFSSPLSTISLLPLLVDTHTLGGGDDDDDSGDDDGSASSSSSSSSSFRRHNKKRRSSEKKGAAAAAAAAQDDDLDDDFDDLEDLDGVAAPPLFSPPVASQWDFGPSPADAMQGGSLAAFAEAQDDVDDSGSEEDGDDDDDDDDDDDEDHGDEGGRRAGSSSSSFSSSLPANMVRSQMIIKSPVRLLTPPLPLPPTTQRTLHHSRRPSFLDV